MMADWASRWRKETSHPKQRSFRSATSATGYARQLGKDRSFSSSEFRLLHPRQSDLPNHISPSLRSLISFSSSLPSPNSISSLALALSRLPFFWGEMASRRLLEIHPSLQPVIVALLRPIAFKLGGGGGGFLSGSIGATVSRPKKRQRSKEEKKWREDQSRNLFLLFFPLLLKMAWLTRLFRESTHTRRESVFPLKAVCRIEGKERLAFFHTPSLSLLPCFSPQIARDASIRRGERKRGLSIFSVTSLSSFPSFLSPILPHHISRKKYWKNQRVYII